jgi:hypothetical protein
VGCTARTDHALAELGQAFAQLGVRGLLVDQAALEPAALARDFRRRQHEALIFGHLDRDRHELGQPRRAAQREPARADAADGFRFVAHAELAQLGPHAGRLRERRHEVAQIEPIVARVVDDELAAAELDAKHFERQPQRARFVFGEAQRVGAIGVGFFAAQILLGRAPDHAA